jgi:hypothetical protein
VDDADGGRDEQDRREHETEAGDEQRALVAGHLGIQLCGRISRSVAGPTSVEARWAGTFIFVVAVYSVAAHGRETLAAAALVGAVVAVETLTDRSSTASTIGPGRRRSRP